MHREDMEVDSSSWHVQKLWSCKVRSWGSIDKLITVSGRIGDVWPGTLESVWYVCIRYDGAELSVQF